MPTLNEMGVKNAEVTSWFGIMVPAGTPSAVIDILGRSLRSAADKPEFPRNVEKQGLDPTFLGVAEAGEFWAAEIEKWAAVIKAAGIVGQ